MSSPEPDRGPLDFVYLERGLEVLADRIAVRDRVDSDAAVAEVDHCLRQAWDQLAGARGTAADRFRGLLFDLYAEDVTVADVATLRASLADLAASYGTMHEQTRSEERARSQAAGRAGGKRRKGIADDRHEGWIRAAEAMRKRNDHRKAEDLARAIAEGKDETARPDTIARVLRRHGF